MDLEKVISRFGILIEFATLFSFIVLIINTLSSLGYSSSDFNHNAFLFSQTLGSEFRGTGWYGAVSDFPIGLMIPERYLDFVRGQCFILFLTTLANSFTSTSPVAVGLKVLLGGSKSFPKLAGFSWFDKVRYAFFPLGILLLYLVATGIFWLILALIVMVYLAGEQGWQCVYRVPIYALFVQSGILFFVW